MTFTQSFTVTQPTRIHFGSGAISELGKTIKDFSCSNVLLVVDPGVVEAGLIASITAPLKKAKRIITILDPDTYVLQNTQKETVHDRLITLLRNLDGPEIYDQRLRDKADDLILRIGAGSKWVDHKIQQAVRVG